MSFSVRGEGNLPTELVGKLRIALADALHLVGRALVKRVQDGMRSGGKSGRVYKGHQASAPGEYSAIQSGDLIGSINYRVAGATFISFFATSGHAGYQEYGTRKMAARPNLKKAIDESDGEIRNIIDLCVRRAIGA